MILRDDEHRDIIQALDLPPLEMTEEQAEVILRKHGTSGSEVINEFIERLLKENLELKTKLAATTQPSDAARAAAEEIRERFLPDHRTATGATAARDEIAAIISNHLGLAGVPEPAAEAVHYTLFAPCAENDHSDCIEYSNGLRRDAQLTRCICDCHAVTEDNR